MKYLILLLLSVYLLSSCDTTDGGQNLKPIPGKVLIADSTGNNPAENIIAEISYNFNKVSETHNDAYFYNTPNPLHEISVFHFEALDPSKVDIILSDLVASKESKIASFLCQAGYHAVSFNINSVENLGFPLLKTYLKFDDKLDDSTNIMYLDITNTQYLSMHNKVTVLSLVSDKNGLIALSDRISLWFKNKIPIYAENGDYSGYYEVLENLSIRLINESKGKISEFNVNYSDIIKTGVVLKAP